MAAGSHPPAWSRLVRRIFRPFLTRAEKKRVAAAIAEVERRTSGSIHVEVVGRLGGQDPLERARGLFEARGLHENDSHNDVLILISHLDHRFAIWGDRDIHAKAGQRTWERAGQVLRAHFGERRYAEGIEACVREIGEELSRHFPA